jgi:hypothetical protein
LCDTTTLFTLILSQYNYICVYRVFEVGNRAFSDGVGEGFQGGRGRQSGMTIPDFIYFMLAEEDKTSVPAIKFW